MRNYIISPNLVDVCKMFGVGGTIYETFRADRVRLTVGNGNCSIMDKICRAATDGKFHVSSFAMRIPRIGEHYTTATTRTTANFSENDRIGIIALSNAIDGSGTVGKSHL